MKSELRKQQYTVTLFDCNHLLTQVIHVVLWQMEKSYVLLYSFFFILNLRAVSKYKLLGAYIWRGDLTKGFLR